MAIQSLHKDNSKLTKLTSTIQLLHKEEKEFTPRQFQNDETDTNDTTAPKEKKG
ncbi:625_t:CDS:2 [Gigaspora rosea]|nr:625_t:CDS:2 [Gigaspora rosea]